MKRIRLTASFVRPAIDDSRWDLANQVHTTYALGTRFIAPTNQRSDIDVWIQSLGPLKISSAAPVIPVHARVMQLFKEISGLEKRALASKYLHFHFPKLVHIYDERADRAIRKVTAPRRGDMPDFDNCDPTYARFFLRCETLRTQLQDMLGQPVSPRELDKVLLAVAR